MSRQHERKREAWLGALAHERGLRLRRYRDKLTGDVEWWLAEPDGCVVDGVWSSLEAVEAALTTDG